MSYTAKFPTASIEKHFLKDLALIDAAPRARLAQVLHLTFTQELCTLSLCGGVYVG